MTNMDITDYKCVTPEQAIELFKMEEFELALVPEDTITRAADLAEQMGEHWVASDIGSRYDNLQEELRCMMAEFN